MPPPRISVSVAQRPFQSTFRTPFRSICFRRVQRQPQLPKQDARFFSNTTVALNWLQPVKELNSKTQKGRPRVAKGGSTRGTTVIWGDYGLRLRDHDRRITASQLRVGEEVIKRRMRGSNFRFFSRFAADVPVFEKPQETRMGTGKGRFSYWSCRVPVSRILFELSSDSHEQVIRDAFRLAAAKLPGK